MIMKWINKKIDERIMKKMSEPIDKLEDVVYEIAHEIDIDYDKLAEALSIDPADIAGGMNESEIADHMEVDYYTLADKIDVQDVASHVNSSDIAYELDIDYDKLAKLIDVDAQFGSAEVAAEIDMSELAAQVYGNFVSIEDVSSIISDIKSIVLAVRKEEE
tara:strand:+ start:65 stop:547 length:483 start_codon:yes stop_codon:yes gene_type:complete